MSMCQPSPPGSRNTNGSRQVSFARSVDVAWPIVAAVWRRSGSPSERGARRKTVVAIAVVADPAVPDPLVGERQTRAA
jgi:hypothetical protein